MLKKLISALAGKSEGGKTQTESGPIKPAYLAPWCELHDRALIHVERTRPRRGTREYTEKTVSSMEDFAEPQKSLFPHSRPTDPWLTHYDYCQQCESQRLNHKERTTVDAKREAEADERLKKKRHWQDP